MIIRIQKQFCTNLFSTTISLTPLTSVIVGGGTIHNKSLCHASTSNWVSNAMIRFIVSIWSQLNCRQLESQILQTLAVIICDLCRSNKTIKRRTSSTGAPRNTCRHTRASLRSSKRRADVPRHRCRVHSIRQCTPLLPPIFRVDWHGCFRLRL